MTPADREDLWTALREQAPAEGLAWLEEKTGDAAEDPSVVGAPGPPRGRGGGGGGARYRRRIAARRAISTPSGSCRTWPFQKRSTRKPCAFSQASRRSS